MADDFRIKILLVDDQPRNLLALEAVLDNPQYNLVSADSGEAALKALLRDDFAVILMDVMMPAMNGFETAELIRTRDKTRYTPIIFVTAVGTTATEVARGYSVGAVDYLFKPIVPEVLRSKVAAFAELFRKTEEIKRQEQQLRELQRREHEAKLAEAERRLEAEKLQHEMDLAREIQQHLFPRQPTRHQSFDIAGASVPADSAGGDYFDYVPRPQGGLDVVIGDVSGHGVGPALLMAATRAYFRAFAPLHVEPGEILTRINQALADDVPDGRFVTLLLMRVADSPPSLVYANAGHNPAVVVDGNGEVKAELTSTGPPLGIIDDARFETSSRISLGSDDCVLLYTDGVVEAVAPDATPFGASRAIEVVRQRRSDSPSEIVTALQAAVADFIQTEPQRDDVTALLMRVGVRE